MERDPPDTLLSGSQWRQLVWMEFEAFLGRNKTEKKLQMSN